MFCRKSKTSNPAQPSPLGLPTLITAAVLAVSAGVLFLCEPTHYGFYPQCFFHHSTGLLCPGCGSLRAMHQLLHGHVARAFRDNALLITALPFLGWYGLQKWLLRTKPPVIARKWPMWLLWMGVGVVVVFGVVRNLPFAGVEWLRP